MSGWGQSRQPGLRKRVAGRERAQVRHRVLQRLGGDFSVLYREVALDVRNVQRNDRVRRFRSADQKVRHGGHAQHVPVQVSRLRAGTPGEPRTTRNSSTQLRHGRHASRRASLYPRPGGMSSAPNGRGCGRHGSIPWATSHGRPSTARWATARSPRGTTRAGSSGKARCVTTRTCAMPRDGTKQPSGRAANAWPARPSSSGSGRDDARSLHEFPASRPRYPSGCQGGVQEELRRLQGAHELRRCRRPKAPPPVGAQRALRSAARSARHHHRHHQSWPLRQRRYPGRAGARTPTPLCHGPCPPGVRKKAPGWCTGRPRGRFAAS